MQLTVRDVAELLNVSDKGIYRWIPEGNLPAYRVSGGREEIMTAVRRFDSRIYRPTAPSL